jgi:hypothetical protein
LDGVEGAFRRSLFVWSFEGARSAPVCFEWSCKSVSTLGGDWRVLSFRDARMTRLGLGRFAQL